MSFSLTPKTAFPRPQSDGFPQGIQWQADGTPLGDRHVQTVNLRNFGSGGVTRDADTLTIVAPTAAGGGGGTLVQAQGLFSMFGGVPPTLDLPSAFTSFNTQDYEIWENLSVAPTPCVPQGSTNEPGFRTFTVANVGGIARVTFIGGSMSESDVFVKMTKFA